MSQTVKDKVTNESSQVDRIIGFLHSLDYSMDEFKEFICLPLAQWLHDEGFSIENTGLVVTSIANITDSDLADIYDENVNSLHSKADLITHLSQKEYEQLEQIIKPVQKVNSFSVDISAEKRVKIDFQNQRIIHIQDYQNAKGETNSKETPVIEAVPSELIVYDSEFAEETRTFKATWTSKYSTRAFVTSSENSGATIKETETALINAGYSFNKNLMSDTLSAVFNGMIKKGLAIVKDTIDNKGVYYSNGKLLVVKLDVSVPKQEELEKAVSALNELKKSYKKEETVLATVLKWSLASVFSYARKQAGASEWFPWLYLVGTGQSGKTTLAKIGYFFYGLPSDEVNIGGTSFNTDYRIGLNVSRDCCTTIVNEPKATFKNEFTVETVKNCVELRTCRKVQGKIYPAFSPVIFTSNGFLPEMDSLYRRLFIIDFNYSQRKVGDEKKEFKKKFNVESPSKSFLKDLGAFGKVALRTVMSNPDLLYEDWKDFADKLMMECYKQSGSDVPRWLKGWSKDKELADLDEIIIEDIQAILAKELYNASKRYNPHNEYDMESKSSSSSKSFEPMVWDLLDNKRAFNWALPHQPWGKEKGVFLNQGFKRLLAEEIDEIGSLESIAQLLRWEYKRVRFGKSSKRGILVPFSEFMEFVYPSVE